MSRGARIGITAALLALAATITLLILSTHGIRVLPKAGTSSPAALHPLETRCHPPAPEPAEPVRVGVALGGAITDAKINSFASTSGVEPAFVEIYRQFGQPFSWNLACDISRRGALPLLNLGPRTQPVHEIATGRYDTYLAAYAHQVARFKLPVAISFGHEMNGSWYPWGWKHTTPADFIAAWRHIHAVFVKAGANNVTWIWIVSPRGRLSSAQRPWWPGSDYVTWVGIDAYYREPSTTFGVFSGMFAKIRKFTNKPVLITETGVAPNVNAASQVKSLFLGVESHPGMVGFIWFDQDRKEKWKLEGDPAVDTAFRHETEVFK